MRPRRTVQGRETVGVYRFDRVCCRLGRLKLEWVFRRVFARFILT